MIAALATGDLLPFERVFVTGASGFVGGHLLPALRKVLQPGARLAVGAHGQSPPDAGESLPFDLNDQGSVKAAVAAFNPDAVIHLAGQASVAAAGDAARQTWQTNFCGSLALAGAVATHCPEAVFLFASSAEIYGRAYLREVADEGTTPQPLSVYARSKFAAEQMLTDVLPATASLIIARPSNHVGAGQSDLFALSSFAAQIARAESGGAASTICVGNLDSERDFLDVRDVVAAYIQMLGSPALRRRQTTLNVSSGVSRSLRSLLDALLRMSGRPVEIVFDPLRARPSEIRSARVDASLLRTTLEWRPEFALPDTLRVILDDARSRLANNSG